MRTGCTFHIATPRNSGAIAIVDLIGDVDAALRALGLRAVAVGEMALRDVPGADRALVARWSDAFAQITPHAGVAAVRSVVRALEGAGITSAERPEPRAAYPEAADDLEALALDAIARAASPLAIDLLADQPRRWRARDRAGKMPDEIDRSSAILDRLITPPTVAAGGRTNVGKSSLLNALARKPLAIVADEPGTTRDHVGALIDLAGFVVRWIDTPGERDTSSRHRAPPIELEAAELARAVVAGADLILLCGDAASGFPDSLASGGGRHAPPTLRVATRADQGVVPGADVVTAARPAAGPPSGLSDLARAIRDALVPPETLDWPGPWRFDPRLDA